MTTKTTRATERKPSPTRNQSALAREIAARSFAQAFEQTFVATNACSSVSVLVNLFLGAMREELEHRERSWKATSDAQARAIRATVRA